MHCLRCGKDVDDLHAFCPDCQKVMETTPVKPGTPIYLPQKKEPADKKPHRRPPTPAKIHNSLKKLIRWMAAIIAVLVIIICLLAGMLLNLLSQQNTPTPEVIGKNYTTNITSRP